MGDGSWIHLESNTLRSEKNSLKFDCAICGDSLQQPGPPLQFFSFGKLVSTNELSLIDQELIYREFLLSDPLYKCGTYDCHKVLSTECGHLFHSGCLREWFFMKRYDRYTKCPYCNQRTRYHDCRVLHPVAVFERSNEGSSDDEASSSKEARKATTEPLDYSDISCESSSYSSEEISDDEDRAAPTSNTTTPTNNVCGPIPNEIIYELHLAEPQIDIPDIDIVEESEEDSADYGPFASVSYSINHLGRLVVEAYDKYNIAYFYLLIWAFNVITKHHEGRMKEHLKNMDDAEDETLVEATGPIPLGYPFILQFLLTGFFIWLHEKSLINIRKLL
ncbi:E3 ubiquitin-protein ligase RFWD3 [Orchesella cincta]|uniref:E3 ubiquitin-protein ligase RFWD3 n=1 Tax=Orchesella cincta TaxID=48709 RepID=A0A1D2MYT5_ORCCI|nr:E3 ubiquitin-protein ligase RFWD3 [Orchesella cincta]